MSSGGGSLLDGIMQGGGGEESAALINSLFDSRKSQLKMITEISPELIYPMAVMTVIANKYKSPILNMFISELYQLMISKDRKGRAELIEALLASRSSGGESDF